MTDVSAADDVAVPVLDTPPPRAGLWHHRNFLYFWVGQSSSELGSAVTAIALPLVGVLLLGLDAFHMGAIASASAFAVLIASPFIGPVVDAMDRRRLMIITDVGRALLLVSVPIAYWLHVLSFAQLIVVGGGMGVLTLAFTVAHQTFLPTIVQARSLADGNSKLEASESAAQVSGPGLAGWLIGIGGPAVAIVLDVVSYVVSVFCLIRVRIGSGRSATSPPAASSDTIVGDRRVARFLRDTKSGFNLLWDDPVLRAVGVSYAALGLFAQIQVAVYMLFLVRSLHFSATLIGVIFSLSAVVGFVSALAGGRLTDRLGAGRLIVIGQAGMVAGGISLAAVAGSTIQAAGTMLLAEAFFAAGMSIYGVGSRTLNQTRVADEIRGRVIGASKVLYGIPVTGAGLIGGGLGTAFGLRTAMVVGAVGMTLALALVLRPQVWAVRAVPRDAQSPGTAA